MAHNDLLTTLGDLTLFWPSSVHICACAYTQTYIQVHIHSYKIYLREKESQIKMYCYGSKGEIQEGCDKGSDNMPQRWGFEVDTPPKVVQSITSQRPEERSKCAGEHSLVRRCSGSLEKSLSSKGRQGRGRVKCILRSLNSQVNLYLLL